MADSHDRRRHPRYDIELQGLLMASGGPAQRCLVRDYCLGGLLVEQLGQEHRVPRPGDQVRIDAKLTLPEGPRPIGMRAVVVWQRDAHLGLSFQGQSPEYFDLLDRHGQVEPVAGRAHQASGSEVRARARLRHAARRLLPALVHEVLVVANTRLLDLADRVRSNAEQSQLFADMNVLDRLKHGDRLVNAVLAECEDPQPANETGVPGSELSLIDPDEFERWLEASRVATMLDRQFSDALCALTSRLLALRGAGAPREQQAPFEPQHFTKAVKGVARELELGRATRIELFEAMRLVLTDRLGDFYAALHQVLDELGVPQAAAKQYRVPKPPADRQDGGEDAQPDQGPSDHASGNTPQEARIEHTAPGDTAARGTTTVPLLPVDPALIARGRAQVSATRAAQATDLLDEAAAGQEITASMRDWLRALDAPLQQAAAADPALFHDDANPLRRIIDGLGHLQLFRPVPDGPPESDDLRQRVDELLRPLSAQTADPATITSVAQGIAQLTDQQSQRYQQNAERVVEASEGRERVRLARLRVVETLNERYALKEVPEVMVELLESGWRSMLELALLRVEDAEALFAERLGIIDDLTARLGGQAHDDERERLGSDRLVEVVRAELAAAAFDPFRVAAVLKRMGRELAATPAEVIRLVRFTPLVSDEDGQACFTPPTGVADEQWPAILGRCEEVGVADRLRFLDPRGGEATELRVAWIRSDRGLFTLVDHRGVRQRDITCADLALGLHRREILLEPVDGLPLSERAADGLLARMEERLAHEASHDSLTGLINRNQFRAALEQLLRRSEGASGVMFSIDIDQFRLVNEIHGYDNGDRLLIAVARMLEKTKGFSVLSHIGGDRFAMLLPETPLDQAERHAETIREQISSMPFSVATHALSVTVSIGVVAVSEGEVIGNLMQSVEDALSAAKANGGNCVYRFNEDDPEIRRHRESVQWVAQVDEALARGRLKLRCQAIVPITPDKGLAPHYEVLLGVASAQHENLPIAEFIDAAERYNRMRAVDRWVTRTVIEWIAQHRALMPSLQGFAVNLSGQTASDPAFVDFLRQQFQRTGIDPSWLSLEVTETAAVADLSTSAGIIRDLKRLGCRVALDDFGSGLASYSYLKEMPVDWLKIDGAFVRKIAADHGDYAVVKSINEIGHFLGKETIAEYVADQRILELVAEIGVDYAQGFAIAKPVLMDSLVPELAVAN